MRPAIYKINSLSTNKIYVGSAVNYNKRKNNHLSALRTNTHPNKILQNHVNKYGMQDIDFIILEDVENKENLISREQFYIDLLKPHFNILTQAGSRLGTKHTEEYKKQASIIHRNISDETRRRMSKAAKGRLLSEETKLKVGKASRKWERSKEVRKKMSESAKNRINKPLTQEHKNKISIANKGKIRTEEAKLKYSNAKKGVRLTDEHIKNLRKFAHVWTEEEKLKKSKLLTGRTLSEETKQRMRDTWRIKRAAKLPPPNNAIIA